MNLPDVARTAILTLICRVLETEKQGSAYKDPMAVLCFERLIAEASEEEKAWILKRKQMYQGRGTTVVKENIQRQTYFDQAADHFISDHPGCAVINLGCGLDTRFWRLQNRDYTYIEVDLPELIELKQHLLQDELSYELIGCSVLDAAWIDQVTSTGNSNFLLLAEGLFMYLPSQEAIRLLQAIGKCFNHSQLILDTYPEKYTKGILKWLSDLRIKAAWELNVSLVFGIKDPHDIETYSKGLKVVDTAKGPLGPIVTVSINA